jgi:hypothetical protein
VMKQVRTSSRIQRPLPVVRAACCRVPAGF